MRNLVLWTCSLLLITGLSAPFSTAIAQSKDTTSNAKPTLGTIFKEDRMFTNKAFSASIRFAGLVDTLESEGPFTVFVFTNEAASSLEKEFSNPQSDPEFHSLIEYHVVPGRKVMASDFLEIEKLSPLEGPPISVETKGGTTVVAEGGEGGQRVSKQPETIILKGKNTVTIGPDPTRRNITTASNGVIHILGSVLRPPSQ